MFDKILEEVDREYEQYQASIRWGAIATALWNDYEGVAHVAVGSSVNATSEHEAQQNALSQCIGAGGQGCQIVDSWNAGCGYIAIGKTSNGVFHVGGTTSTEALNRCWAEGYDCEGPIGGCVE